MIGECYALPPYEYTKAAEIILVFETDREAVAALLPEPLQPAARTYGSIRVMRHALGVFGPYTGVYLAVTAEFRGRPTVHIVTGVKTDFAGTAAGRELWGLPLQMGSVTMEWHGEVLQVEVGRTPGLPLATLALQLVSRTEPRAGGDWLTTAASVLPTFTAAAPDHALIGLATDHSYDDAAMWDAHGVLELHRGTPRDDWSSIPVGRIVRTTYMTGGRSVLHAGEILATWR